MRLIHVAAYILYVCQSCVTWTPRVHVTLIHVIHVASYMLCVARSWTRDSTMNERHSHELIHGDTLCTTTMNERHSVVCRSFMKMYDAT